MKILVVFGGQSVEHDISILTGSFIINTLKSTTKYEPVPLYISKEGLWYSEPVMTDLEFFKSPDFGAKLARFTPVNLSLGNGLTLLTGQLLGRKTSIDIVFPALHGTYGEDGSLMGLLRLAGIPYVGCDMQSSVVAMDKALTKQVLAAEGLDVVPWIHFTKEQWQTDKAALTEKIRRLNLPLFVKPVHLGSSIAISKIKDLTELENAIELALYYDTKALVEEAVPNLIEVTCLALGNTQLTTSLVERPKFKEEFLNFDDKYIHQGGAIRKGSEATTEIPAQISETLTKQVQELTISAFRAIGASGMMRCDFLIDSETNKIYLNEINTLPGTLYAHNWKKSGLGSEQLIDKLIELAIEKFESDKKTARSFSSSVLNQDISGSKFSQN